MEIGKLGVNIINSSDLDKSVKPPEPINKDGLMEVGAYLEALQNKTPGYRLGVGVVSQGNIPGGSRSITIAPNVLRAMAADPEVAVKYEELISDYMKSAPQFERMRAAMGQETVAAGMFINADGTAGCYIMTRPKDASGNREGSERTILQSLEEMLEKSRKRRELQMKHLEELQEVREARKQAERERVERAETRFAEPNIPTESAARHRIDFYA